MQTIFESEVAEKFIDRINNLSNETQAKWGKMSVDQMLAHCNVTYEMIYEDKHPKATGIKKFLLKSLVKPIVCTDKPYKQNSRTAPAFIISDARIFEDEKNRLVTFIRRTAEMGETKFDGMESNSFGPLSIKEWNNMFTKHLNHHLDQFGV